MWTIKGWYEDAREQAARRQEWYRGMGDLFIQRHSEWMPGVSPEEITRRLAAWNRDRLGALPDLNRYPELQGMRDLVDAEWRGWRDGARMSPEQWTAYCAATSYYHRHLKGGAGVQCCSFIYFPASDHGPLLASNLDSTPDQPYDKPEWPLINEHLIAGAVSSGVFLDEVSPEIFPAPVMKLVGRYCRNTKEAVDMLTRYNCFWGPCNLIVVDRANTVAMIEKSACRIGVRYSRDGFGFITAMTAEEPGMKAWLANRRAESLKVRKLPARCVDTAYWEGADGRQRLMTELLEEARGNPTLEGMRRMIQFRDPKRGKVCYNGEILFPPDGPPCEYTLCTTIWCLSEGRALWWGKEGDKPSYENRKPDVEYSDVMLWK